MIEEQKHVREWMVKAAQETPDRPTMPDFEVRKLRVTLIAEELAELCDAFGLKLSLNTMRGKKPRIEVVGNDAKPSLNHYDLVEAYDGVNDLLVVVLGAGVAMGTECKPGFDEVMASNDSKFIDGHRREDGKWVKGPSHRKAALSPIIEAQLVAARERDKQPSLV